MCVGLYCSASDVQYNSFWIPPRQWPNVVCLYSLPSCTTQGAQGGQMTHASYTHSSRPPPFLTCLYAKTHLPHLRPILISCILQYSSHNCMGVTGHFFKPNLVPNVLIEHIRSIYCNPTQFTGGPLLSGTPLCGHYCICSWNLVCDWFNMNLSFTDNLNVNVKFDVGL